MGFKTVFLAVGNTQDHAEVDRAVEICGRLGAQLALLTLGIAPPPPASPYGVVSNDIWASEIRDGRKPRRRGPPRSRQGWPGPGISVAVDAQYIDRGSVPPLAARFARYADLTLVTPQLPKLESMQSWVMDGALFESGRPVLLLPKGATSFPEAKVVMLGWNASVQAAKAVRDAIGLMQKADAVHAVLVEPVPSFDGHGPEPGSISPPTSAGTASRRRSTGCRARARTPASCCAAPRPTWAPS